MSDKEYDVLPECRVVMESLDKSIGKLEKQVEDIHNVVYKNGLVTSVSKNEDNIKRMMDTQVWLMRFVIGTGLGVLVELIITLIKSSP